MAAYDFINLTGLIVPDTSTTKTEVQNEYKLVFGDDIDLDDETPEGVLIASETISRNGIAVNNAAVANQINPNYAGGIFLDAVWALTAGITGGRQFATHSTFSVLVDLTGVPSTFIAQGSLAIVSATGAVFESIADATLDGSGLASVGFQSVETGPINAAIGDLDSLAQGAPLGWETVNNTVAATPGTDDETDEASRLRRRDTMALQGISVALAVTSAIMDIDGVSSLSYRENFTSSPLTIDGVLMAANSIFVCVDGGLDQDIADVLLANKTLGANWNGSVLVVTNDPTTGQPYNVRFERPTSIDTYVTATIGPTTLANATELVQQSVLDYANGDIAGELGFVVGASASPFELGAAINNETPEIFVKSVTLSLDGITYDVVNIPIEIFEKAQTDITKIIVVIS